MSGHGIPSIYADATHISGDTNARLALARAQWLELERRAPAQAHAIKFASKVTGGHRVAIEGTRKATFDALVRKGFVVKLTRLLTPIGEGLRVAAVHTQQPQGDAQDWAEKFPD